MFGGWGLYLDDVMFGLIAAERFYLKVDRETEARFAAAGSESFTYHRGAKQFAMSYREAPAGALGDSDALLAWARLGLEAAARARDKRARTKRRGKR